MGFLAKFLKGIEWWKLEPHPELVLEYPQALASASVRQEYVVYARYGRQLKLDLRASSESDRLRFTWNDLVNSKEARSGTVNGGAIRTFHTPEDYPASLAYKDRVLHVVKIKEP